MRAGKDGAGVPLLGAGGDEMADVPSLAESLTIDGSVDGGGGGGGDLTMETLPLASPRTELLPQSLPSDSGHGIELTESVELHESDLPLLPRVTKTDFSDPNPSGGTLANPLNPQLLDAKPRKEQKLSRKNSLRRRFDDSISEDTAEVDQSGATTLTATDPDMPSQKDESTMQLNKRIQEKRVEITIGDLVKYLTKDVNRSRQSKAVLPYLVFLGCFTALLMIERLSEQEKMFFRDVSLRRQLQATTWDFLATEVIKPSDFDEVNNFETMWGWLDAAVEGMWPQGTLQYDIDSPESVAAQTTWTGSSQSTENIERSNIPLGFLLLRQFRVVNESCDYGSQRSVIPDGVRQDMKLDERTCYPAFGEDTVSTAPFTNAQKTFYSNTDVSQKGKFVNSIPRTGVGGTYDQPTKAFSVLLFTAKSYSATIKPKLDELKAEMWVDNATRAVFLEMITYNQADGNFIFTSAVVERLATNAYIPSIQSIPFTYLTQWSSKELTLIILDFIITLFILYDFGDFAIHQKTDRDIHLGTGAFRGLNVWAFFRMIMFGMFIIASYYRGRLWHQSLNITSDYYVKNKQHILADFSPNPDPATVSPEDHQTAELLWMWYNMADYAYIYSQWSVFAAACAVLSYLRLFSFLQYYELANILTETISLAVGELIGVMILGAIVIIGYAITGYILYGNSIEDFRHFRHSLGSLLRAMVSGEVESMNDMVRLHKWESRFFVLTYQILVWLILLNMILAIISGAFTQVQEGMQGQGSFNPLEFIRQWISERIRKVRHSNRRKLRTAPGGGGGGDAESTVVSDGDAKGGQRIHEDDDSDYIRSRVLAVQALRQAEEQGTFRDDERGEGEGGSFITQDDFYTNVCGKGRVGLSHDAVKRIFDKASHEVSASNRSTRRGEKWAQGINNYLTVLSDAVGSINRIQTWTAAIPQTQETQKELDRLMADVGNRLDDVGASVECLDEALRSANTEAKPLGELTEKMRVLRASIEEAVPAIKDATENLLVHSRELCPALVNIETNLNQWLGNLTQDIKRGTLWGPPTEAALTRSIPHLVDAAPGKGVVASVSRYAYPVHYEDADLAQEAEPVNPSNKAVYIVGEEEGRSKRDKKEGGKKHGPPPRSILKKVSQVPHAKPASSLDGESAGGKRKPSIQVDPNDL